MPSFKCRDIGMACDFEVTAKTQDELMKKVAEHPRQMRVNLDRTKRLVRRSYDRYQLVLNRKNLGRQSMELRCFNVRQDC